MNVKYVLIKDMYCYRFKIETSYGIAAFVDEWQQGFKTIVASVHNVSTDGQKVKQLVDKCNEMGLSPVHLDDVVYDMIAAHS